jgi:iron complex outermembrane recepter protein
LIQICAALHIRKLIYQTSQSVYGEERHLSKHMKKRSQHTTAKRIAKGVGTTAVLTLVVAINTAYAQEAAKQETVVVTGIRKGIEDAISVKKDSDNIVEAISAEDIGKLPDPSVAESISRLPGVAAQRNRATGKAQSISVRGMSPDFNGALLNGREQASYGESRGVEFDQYPGELLGSVLVYKTPDASLMGQGVASTIDIRTARPLDFGKRNIAVNYRKQRTGIDTGDGAEEGSGNRLSLSYIDQFADRTFGVALGFARFDEKGSGQQKFNSWGGWAADVPYNGVNVKTPGGFTADTESLDYKRDGWMATLQYKPSKNFESVLDIFYSDGTTNNKKTGLEGAIGGMSAGPYDPPGTLTNATIVNGVATSGTIDNYKGVVRNHIEASDDKLTSIGWNNKFKLNDWTLVADIAQSKVKRHFERFETTAGLPGNAATLDSISWTGFNGNNFTDVKYTTGLNYSNRSVIKLTDVDGWSGGTSSPQAGYYAAPNIDDTLNTLKLSGKTSLNFGPIAAAEVGLNISDRSKVKTTNEGRLVIKGGDPYGAVDVPGGAVGIAGTTGIPVVSWNPRGSLGTIYDIVTKVDTDIYNKTWTVKEKITTAYLKGDLDGQLFGLSYRGNVGLQVVNTKQNSTGFGVDKNTCTGNTVADCPAVSVVYGTSFSDFLPSLNVTTDLGSDQVMRLGLGKAITRPNMGDMRASMTPNWDAAKLNPFNNNAPGMYTGDGGNPNLEPFRTTALDLSYEKYFAKKGYISVAAFYKKLDTYILRTARQFDFTNFVTPTPGRPTTGMVTSPVNGEGGNVRGFEVALNVPFSLLTPALDGFGILVNHSDTSSSVSLPASGFSVENVGVTNIPLPGLSKQVTNLRIYYEKYGFQVAVAQRQRSDFLGEISDYQDNRQLTFIKGESILDFQLGYEFQTSYLKGLGLSFQANNLTNADYIRYSNTPDNISEKKKFGKTYLFSVNYKF